MTPALTSDPHYAALKTYVLEHTGLDYYRDKDDIFCDRIGARIGHHSCEAYLDILRTGLPGSPEKGDAELDELIINLTIGETYFFRYQEQFDAMREIVFPEMIRRNQNVRRLRIWSAGCANGAEAFSVAILLRRDFGDQIAGWDITILGTDINREFLARAAEGKFQDWHLRSISDDVKAACFSKSGKEWVLAPEYRRMVSFKYHNLVKHPFPSLLHNLCGFDMILCRNATIYFHPEIVQKIIGHFRDCLVESGWLLVGHAEPNIEYYRDFEIVTAPGAILYRKGIAAPEIADSPEWQPPALEHILVPNKIAAPKESAPPSELDEIRLLADRGELENALNRCSLFIQINPLNALAHFYEALIQEQMGDHMRREASLRRAIYLNRQFVLAHYSLGLALLKNGKTDHAERSLHNAISLVEGMKDDDTFSEADGISVADLRELMQMHLEAIEKR